MMLPGLLILLLSSSPSPATGDRWFCSNANATYTPNSTYMSNMDSLAGSLIAGATKLHSATGTTGTGSDRVYGAVLCRGDSTGADCGRRLRDAFGGFFHHDDGAGAAGCAHRKDVALYNELYHLRFSDQDFLSTFSNSPEWVDATTPNLVPAADDEQFEEVVGELLRALADAAARQPERYAADRGTWPSRKGHRTVYGLVQCTRDMPSERCRACLHGVMAERREQIGDGKTGGAIHGVRCSLRYETDTQFFTVTGSGQRKGHAILIIGTVYPLSIICTRLFFCLLSIRRKQKKGKLNSMEQPTNMDEIMRLWRMEDAGSEFSLYDFSQIAVATNNFSASNILGEGGFGPVYKAWGMWKDGRWYEFMDQSFGDEYEPGEMTKCLVVALMCVQEKAMERPTMSDVVAMLGSDDITLPEPRQPAYSHIRVDVSVDANVTCSRNDITITATDGR